MKLTKTAIERLPTPTAETWLWCSEVSGFGIRIHPSGNRQFVLRYRIGKRQRKYTIGSYQALTVEQARQIARDLKHEIAKGSDPAKRKTDITTIGQLWQAYCDGWGSVHIKPSSYSLQQKLWRNQLKPHFEKTNLLEVKRADVVKFHLKWKLKPVAGNRAVALLSKMYNLAVDWGMIEHNYNPAARIPKFKEYHRERVLNSDEIERLKQALDAYPHKQMKRLIRLLLLTGCRVSEIAHSHCDWVDFENGLLKLPDSKTGAKNIPLSAAALAELEPCRGQWIIPAVEASKKAKGFLVCPNTHWFHIRKAAGIPDVRLHDLRHTVATYAHKSGLTHKEVADLLGHRQLSTTERYINSLNEQGSRNAEKVSEMFGL